MNFSAPPTFRAVTSAAFAAAIAIVSIAALSAQSAGAPGHSTAEPAARALGGPGTGLASLASLAPSIPATTSPAVASSSATAPSPVVSTSAAPRPTVRASARPSTRPAAPAAQPAAQEQHSTRPAPAPVRSSQPAPPRSSPAPKPPSKPAPSKPPVKTSPPPSGSSASGIAWAVLSAINSERAAHGLPALHMNSNLISSAHGHNLAMAAANEMSHQLPGEPPLSQRLLNAGYRFYYGGENIGWTTDQTTDGVLAVHEAMYNEVPPNDGHRQNILSTHYTDVGIDVYIDARNGKAWITEDFGSQR